MNAVTGDVNRLAAGKVGAHIDKLHTHARVGGSLVVHAVVVDVLQVLGAAHGVVVAEEDDLFDTVIAHLLHQGGDAIFQLVEQRHAGAQGRTAAVKLNVITAAIEDHRTNAALVGPGVLVFYRIQP